MKSLQSSLGGGAFPPARHSSAGALALKGERLCLDFINTKSGRGTSSEQDHLQVFEDLLAWAEHAGILSGAECEVLSTAASKERSKAHSVLQDAVALRETLHRIFSAIAEHDPVSEEDVTALNRWIGQAYPHLRLRVSFDRFAFSWPQGDSDLVSVLRPVVGSAADVLTQERPNRIKCCPGSDCGWLFLDTTKNGTRRWCDMATCGNRAKARLHYRRHRDAGMRCE
jgi:predicted RNA-binding Zn ribbon-like protein